MMSVEATHPWITFDLPTVRFPAKLWVLLGEAQSKCDHLTWVPLRPEVRERLHRIYLAKGALATAAIEGNTLSHDQVERHLKGELSLPPSQEYLGQEIANIVDACNAITSEIAGGAAPRLDCQRVCEWNGLILRKLPGDQDVVPGVFRQHDVGVARYRAPDAREVPDLMDRFCTWIQGLGEDARDADARVVEALVQSIFAHLYLAWIHPFGDGNGRTARLIEFFLLVRAGVPLPAAHLLSDHYNTTRAEYYRQLDKASRSRDPIPFVQYAVQGFVDGLRTQLDEVRTQVIETTWENFVHAAFHQRHTTSDTRRRHLALAISGCREKGASASEARTLTVRLAESFAGKTERTIQRDLGVLIGLELIRRGADGRYRARTDKILGWQPFANRP